MKKCCNHFKIKNQAFISLKSFKITLITVLHKHFAVQFPVLPYLSHILSTIFSFQQTNMKKRIPFSLLFAAFFAAFATPLAAQNIEQEVSDFAQKWQAAFNRADAAALGAMYTDQVISYNADGSSVTVSKADIEASFVKDFSEFFPANGHHFAYHDGSARRQSESIRHLHQQRLP